MNERAGWGGGIGAGEWYGSFEKEMGLLADWTGLEESDLGKQVLRLSGLVIMHVQNESFGVIEVMSDREKQLSLVDPELWDRVRERESRLRGFVSEQAKFDVEVKAVAIRLGVSGAQVVNASMMLVIESVRRVLLGEVKLVANVDGRRKEVSFDKESE